MNLLAPCDALYRKLPSHPYFWLLIWITWFSVLWMLSSRVPEIKHGPKIPHFDKVAHFCYFTAGGFLMANFLHLKTSFPWRRLALITIIIGATVGIIDEYHQTFTPGRTGNDLGDWIADFTGTIAGVAYCYFMWLRIKRLNPST